MTREDSLDMVSVIVIKYSDWRIPIDSIRTCYYLLAGLGQYNEPFLLGFTSP